MPPRGHSTLRKAWSVKRRALPRASVYIILFAGFHPGALLICPKCRMVNARRSHRRGGRDALYSLAALRPWRCRTCEQRFYAWSVPVSFLAYVHCTRCGNLDLQSVSRDLVDEGPLRWIWRLLRVPAYRCPPCRFRFFSLRPEYPVETLPQRAAAEPAAPDSAPPAAP